MYLQRLEIAGFKSFSSRMKFDFQAGVSAIVGPNGSGKSNVAEAIRWVLGEQNIRGLRARKTEELIYSGNDLGRSKASMAEVIMTLAGKASDTQLGLEELIISRRLYRSGESEYRLNGRLVKVKDLHKILAQAGFGTASYAVIGQGMVETLIIASPAERKLLFEEASGIRAFELERTDTLRKLSRAEEQAASLRHEITQLEPERDKLASQVGRLDRRRELSQQLSSGRSQYLGQQLSRLQTAAKAAQDSQEQSAKDRDKQRARLKQLTLQAGSLATASSAASDRQATLLRDLEKLDTERTTITQELAGAEAELHYMEQATKRLDERPTDLAARDKALVSRLADLEKSLATLAVKSGALDDKITLFNDKISALNTQLNGLRQKLVANQRNEYLKHAQGLASLIHKKTQDDKGMPMQELRLALHKLIRMVKLASEADTINLPLSIAKIQQAIARELAKREDIVEQQTTEIIRIRSIELDVHAIEKERAEIKDRLAKMKRSAKQESPAIVTKRAEAKQLATDLAKLEKEAKAKREELSAFSSQANTEEQVELAREVEGVKQGVSELEHSHQESSQLLKDIARETNQLERQARNWQLSMPKPAVGERQEQAVSLADLARIEAELAVIGTVDETLAGAHVELSSRIEFLDKQATDLESAVTDLRHVLTELERRIKTTFRENFGKINKAFGSYFHELFSGGTAALELVTFEDDEYGIEITARPPGKRVELLSALSGGEKALSAVALLAAILDVNPSPFIVLDEVDAALDDTNSRLFTSMLKRLAKKSQLLVITHNHETMLQADELFGITASPKTASTVIAVDLRQAEELVATS